MSPTEMDFDAPPGNKCAGCKNTYFIFADSDPILCHHCTRFLDTTAPRTQEEADVEALVSGLTDDQLRAVGLGRFFELEDPPPPTNHDHSAQMSALKSQLTHQRKGSASNVSQTPAIAKATVATSTPVLQSQARRRNSSFTLSGMRPGPETSDMIRQWVAMTEQDNNISATMAGHSRTSSTSSAEPKIKDDRDPKNNIPAATAGHSRKTSTPLSVPMIKYDGDVSPSVQAQANKTRKRGSRMICATCHKDSPINGKNDGVNCTRCYSKLTKGGVYIAAIDT